MRRYLITGGAGFIGSHLVSGLLLRGDFVTVIDDLSTGNWGNIASFESNEKFRAIIASADERLLMEREVSRHDFVYHLASAVGVKLIIERPVETVQRIVRTMDVLVDVCMRYRVPLLLTSTSEVYGKSDRVPFSEDNDITLGATSKRRWAYASAKMLDEFLALAHYYQTSLPVFIVRLFNTVGPKQTGQYGMVMPRFINAAIKNEPLEIYGDGNQQRCFCSVFDIVEALLKFDSTPQAIGQVINLGSNEEISIRQLAEKIIDIVKSKSKLKFISYEEAYGLGFDDMRRRVPDLTKAKRILNWQPKITLDEIITQIYNQIKKDKN
ncbi:MAG: GDP-mannose 4,6-dehydratase [Planctomycetaceae bacterium]|jgi:UDP-glucose 4-epimerase|nr:GDP-mannose 4,6-dehydratase [Planctomycetaceae bacterium]